MTQHEACAKALREDGEVHFNCCQSVLAPFCQRAGLGLEAGIRLGTYMGGGMKMEATCGAVTGGILALGLMGAKEETFRAFMQRFQAGHGTYDCGALLQANREAGGEKQPFCDGLVTGVVRLVDELLAAEEA